MTKEGFLPDEERSWENVAPGVDRQIMGYDKNAMMVKVRFEAGAEGAPHNHPHVQTTYIAAGSFQVMIDGATQLLYAGDSFFVSSNLVHGVVCREAGLLIDFFHPCREDFLA